MIISKNKNGEVTSDTLRFKGTEAEVDAQIEANKK